MPDKPGLADLFDEEPPNKTMLVIRAEGEDPRIIWRDDAEANRWPGLVGERWFDGPGDPMMLGAILTDATKVYAVVPLESTNLVWLVNPRPGVPSDLPPDATVAFADTIPES
jgi:hypothetical protein